MSLKVYPNPDEPQNLTHLNFYIKKNGYTSFIILTIPRDVIEYPLITIEHLSVTTKCLLISYYSMIMIGCSLETWWDIPSLLSNILNKWYIRNKWTTLQIWLINVIFYMRNFTTLINTKYHFKKKSITYKWSNDECICVL